MIQRRYIQLLIFKRRKFCINNTYTIVRKMLSCINVDKEGWILGECSTILPSTEREMHKGQAGRIGVIGGSLEYTGAPYFAAISALKVGCDLAHVFCAREAAPVIKSYSPELIVHPVLDSSDALELIKPWLPRLHSLVIGPGLGRDPNVLETVGKVIEYCRHETNEKKPLVIDADGLYLLTQKPDVIENYPHGAILTPNAMEFTRLVEAVLEVKVNATSRPNPELVQALAVSLGKNIAIVHKGENDVIALGDESLKPVACTQGGSGRRCGGQGDLLSGSLGVFYCWAILKDNKFQTFPNSLIAAYAACCLTRLCNEKAVEKKGRSTLTTDMLEEIRPAFIQLFGP